MTELSTYLIINCTLQVAVERVSVVELKVEIIEIVFQWFLAYSSQNNSTFAEEINSCIWQTTAAWNLQIFDIEKTFTWLFNTKHAPFLRYACEDRTFLYNRYCMTDLSFSFHVRFMSLYINVSVTCVLRLHFTKFLIQNSVLDLQDNIRDRQVLLFY